jgi:hypothetical protein
MIIHFCNLIVGIPTYFLVHIMLEIFDIQFTIHVESQYFLTSGTSI